MRTHRLARWTTSALAALLACVQAFAFLAAAAHDVAEVRAEMRAVTHDEPRLEASCPPGCTDHEHHAHSPASCPACRGKVVDGVAAIRLSLVASCAGLVVELTPAGETAASGAVAAHCGRGPPRAPGAPVAVS